MGFLDAFRTTTTREPLVPEAKATHVDVPLLPLPSGFTRWQWGDDTFERLSSDASTNAAVFMCLSALSFGYNEPPPQVVNADDEPQGNHPLQALLDSPNPLMSHAELMTYIIYYKAVGGNCYLHKVRNARGKTIELWPYHTGQMRPIPSRNRWIDQYEYYPYGMLSIDAERILIPADDIIHLKWPSIDLSSPWLALAPLRAIAQEVGTDTEMTRYIYALLVNDAVVRTVIQVPEGQQLTKENVEAMRTQFSHRHSGDKRGGVGVLQQGATIARMALNLQELAIEALRRIPEARISGAFRVPAALAGLYVGLEKMTYSNFQEARRQFTEATFVPMWKNDAIEYTQSLIAEFGGRLGERVHYNISHVAALHEEEGQKYSRILQAYDGGVVTINETRAYLGYGKVGDLQILDAGDTFKAPKPAPLPMGQQPPIDVMPMPPPQLTDTAAGKALVRAVMLEQKAAATEPLQKRIERELKTYLAGQYSAYAEAGGVE